KREQIHRRSGGIEEERVPGGRAEALGFRTERPPQLHQAPAQVQERPFLAALRPEHTGQRRARDGPPLPERQESEQPLERAGAEARQRLAAHADCERAEQGNREGRRVHPSPRFLRRRGISCQHAYGSVYGIAPLPRTVSRLLSSIYSPRARTSVTAAARLAS